MHSRRCDVHQIVILEYPHIAAFTAGNARVRRSQVDTVGEVLAHHSTSLLFPVDAIRCPSPCDYLAVFDHSTTPEDDWGDSLVNDSWPLRHVCVRDHIHYVNRQAWFVGLTYNVE